MNIFLKRKINSDIYKCKHWKEFVELVDNIPNPKEKGYYFERLTQIYLKAHPTYSSKLKNVWWCNNNELPNKMPRVSWRVNACRAEQTCCSSAGIGAWVLHASMLQILIDARLRRFGQSEELAYTHTSFSQAAAARKRGRVARTVLLLLHALRW